MITGVIIGMVWTLLILAIVRLFSRWHGNRCETCRRAEEIEDARVGHLCGYCGSYLEHFHG